MYIYTLPALWQWREEEREGEREGGREEREEREGGTDVEREGQASARTGGQSHPDEYS